MPGCTQIQIIMRPITTWGGNGNITFVIRARQPRPRGVTGVGICLSCMLAAAGTWLSPPIARAQTESASAALVSAPPIVFPSDSDSNSPAIWDVIAGRWQLFVLTSVAGRATRHSGGAVSRLVPRGDVTFINPPGHGVWFEAVINDVDGTWYGFYHNEWPDEFCDDGARTIPRIGAARSKDLGVTWQDLGVVLEAPPASYDCDSANTYFVGGVGDFSVVLDGDHRYLYFFFSQYASRVLVQGVSVARMAWADRDAPAGRVSMWMGSETWIPPRAVRNDEGLRYLYPASTPIYRVRDGWHDGQHVDAFWGPSVHWNTYLQQYVMLLNRAIDNQWTQEGVYIAFAPTLHQPSSWSVPQRLTPASTWYPQVLGTELGTGTDKEAGEVARFFLGGRSDYLIRFIKPPA